VILKTLSTLSNETCDYTRSGMTTLSIRFIGHQESSVDSVPGIPYHRHNIELAPEPASAYIRRILAEAIRSRRPYVVSLLLGGYDKIKDESHL
jgi:hypothetical protein